MNEIDSSACALIGASGYVGTTLRGQADFAQGYRSTDIDGIRGKHFQTVICAAAPAQKWIANREPQADRANIDRLIDSLRAVSCNQFILISTVDVFATPIEVDESTPVVESGLHPYGLHRRLLERFVEDHFDRRLIVRLPGLVGPGLRKNVIYDLRHHNSLQSIDSRSVFQFYPMVNLWYDLRIAMREQLSLLHLTAQPLSVAELALEGFGRPFEQVSTANPPRYDFRSLHAARFGGQACYQYNRRESLQAIRAYAQSEPSPLPAV